MTLCGDQEEDKNRAAESTIYGLLKFLFLTHSLKGVCEK